MGLVSVDGYASSIAAGASDRIVRQHAPTVDDTIAVLVDTSATTRLTWPYRVREISDRRERPVGVDCQAGRFWRRQG